MLKVSSNISVDASFGVQCSHETLNIEQIHGNEFTKLLLGALFILSFIPFSPSGAECTFCHKREIKLFLAVARNSYRVKRADPAWARW